MNCEAAREWLLQSDDVTPPADVAAHLNGCTACQKVVANIARLESNWRGLRLPPRADQSKAEFLQHLKSPPSAAQPAHRPRRWFGRLTWAAVAAMVVATGIGILIYWPSEQPVQAQSDVIEQLVDWNLELSEAATPVERERIFADKHEKLKIHVRQAKLSDADRELAENLLANGVWMVRNNDPVEELNRFHRMADRMLEKLQHAANRTDANQSERIARQYAKIAERGIDGNLERIKVAKLADPERKLKIKQLLKEDEARAATLIILVEKGGAGAQKELKRALELSNKRHKGKKGV